MNLLITGATGFVGRNLLLEALRRKRYTRIYVPIRSLEKLRAQFLGDGFEQIPAPITPMLGNAVDWGVDGSLNVDHVVHCAGVLFASKKEEYFKTNVEGSLALLRSLKNSPKIVILSSQAASGPCQASQKEKSETDGDTPLTLYGKSKLEMEKRVLAECPNADVILLRPPMVLGARDTATLPLFKMVQSPVYFKPGFADKFYSFIAVRDLVGAIFSALDQTDRWDALSDRRFYVAAANPISDSDLISTSAKVSERRGIIVKVPQGVLKVVSRIVETIPKLRREIPNLTIDRAQEIWPDRWVVSAESFSRHFGWRAEEGLETVLQETHDWYVKTGQLPRRG